MRARILVVEDDETIREVIHFALADEGYEIAVAPDGQAALERLASFSPDLIVLDLRMPRMDGAAFADAYRARPGPRAPILLLTAAQDANASNAGVGAEATLNKPFDLGELLDLVARLISGGPVAPP